MSVKLSVVVPVYNAERLIGVQLEALAEQQWSEPWEIVLVNNRCTDHTLLIVEQYRSRLPNLRVVEALDKQGQPYALNVGARAARGESLAFCDADDEIAPGWVAAMGTALSQHEFVACRFDTEKLNPAWVQACHSNPQQHGLQKYEYPPYLPHAGGGGLGVRRYLHEAVGGFDEKLLLLHDTDFCWKVQLRGVALHFVPDAVVHIRYRHSLRGMYRQATGYAKYNVFLYKRYRPLGMPALSWKKGLKAWWRLLQGLLRVRQREDWARWVWNFGWRLGRLQGSLEHRVWAL